MAAKLKLPKLKVALGDGGTLDLSSLRGSPVVIYAYPKDSTPGCTREGQDFRDLHGEFEALGAKVFGLSRDSVASHARFAEKQGFPFHLISDPDEALCKALDVIREKKLYGRTFMGIERSTFLFGADGALLREWRKVKVPGHAAEVLQALKDAANA
jgi:peroxiredoxin Q/BCP